MKKRIILLVQIILPMILCVSLLSGCSMFEIYENDAEESTESAEVTSTKRYQMVVEDEDVLGRPGLVLDEENKTFTFTYDLFSSYLPYGTYEVKENILTATTDDGLYKYLFQIVDEDTLKFVKKGSADVSLIDENAGVQIEDGSEFQLTLE